MPDDFSGPPPNLDIPTSLTADSTDTTIQMQNFVFCILYSNAPYKTQPLSAPDYNGAVLTISQIVNLLNQQAANMGYPPNFSYRDGSC